MPAQLLLDGRCDRCVHNNGRFEITREAYNVPHGVLTAANKPRMLSTRLCFEDEYALQYSWPRLRDV